MEKYGNVSVFEKTRLLVLFLLVLTDVLKSITSLI